MTDLHSQGWRQGSVFSAELSVTFCALSAASEVEQVSLQFGRWVVCSQDCDLRGAEVESNEPIIEVRPVFNTDPPDNWGIRSRRFKLAGEDYVDADVPRTNVTPAVLNAASVRREPTLPEGRALAFKSWLGLRYDRPAVPEHLVDLGREIAKRCETKSGRTVAANVHDVLMQFDDSQSPPHVALFAVIEDDADPESVRSWLGNVATRVRTDLGVIAAIEVGTKAQTPLELVETSYSADLSQLTWRGEEPTGAT